VRKIKDGRSTGTKSKQPTFVKAFAKIVIKIEMIVACNHFYLIFEEVKVIVFLKLKFDFLMLINVTAKPFQNGN
jgi:hypothetical protein